MIHTKLQNFKFKALKFSFQFINVICLNSACKKSSVCAKEFLWVKISHSLMRALVVHILLSFNCYGDGNKPLPGCYPWVSAFVDEIIGSQRIPTRKVPWNGATPFPRRKYKQVTSVNPSWHHQGPRWRARLWIESHGQ